MPVRALQIPLICDKHFEENMKSHSETALGLEGTLEGRGSRLPWAPAICLYPALGKPGPWHSSLWGRDAVPAVDGGREECAFI